MTAAIEVEDLQKAYGDVRSVDGVSFALDPQARRHLWDRLSGLNDSGRTVVLTTHHMDEAEALCDRVAIVGDGRILDLDSPTALIRALDALRGDLRVERAAQVLPGRDRPGPVAPRPPQGGQGRL